MEPINEHIFGYNSQVKIMPESLSGADNFVELEANTSW